MKQSTIRSFGPLVCLGAIALGVTLGTPADALAGGYEIPGLGTRGQGRAGAFAVRTDSALALHLNPANLARLSGVNVELALNVNLMGLCFDRSGTPTEDGDGGVRASENDDAPGAAGMGRGGNINDFGAPSTYADTEYPEICNSAGVLPVPQLALSFRPHERVGVGVGLIAPNAGGGRKFGSTSADSLGTYAVPGTATGRLPTPTRYDLIEADLLQVTLAVGVGVELHPRLRVGASIGWGIATIAFTTAISPLAAEDFARDIMTQTEAKDWFVPRLALSVAAEPVDGLEMMAGFIWTHDVKGEGDLTLRPVFWGDLSRQSAASQPIDGVDDGWESVTYPLEIVAPQTSSLSFGARYAMARPGAITTSERMAGARPQTAREGEVSRPFDPMRDEVFDLELDVVVTFSNRVDAYPATVGIVEGQRLLNGVLPLSVIPPIELEHQWKTQVAVSLGGDINVLPETLALRWGFVYESHGVERGYERLDFNPWQLFGGSLGVTLRVQRLEVSAGYMYLHYFDVTNTETQARLRAPGGLGPGTTVNAGVYTAGLHSLSLGVAYRFR